MHGWGGRVIAVGTTVVRALETSPRHDGTRRAPARAGPSLVVTPERGLRAVDGLLTGWHEPEASHLRAARGRRRRPELLAALLRRRAERGYLWHEFGDSHLILGS